MLARGTISAYVFISCLKKLFNDTQVKSLEIFEPCYFDTKYIDDAPFLMKDENSILYIFEKF